MRFFAVKGVKIFRKLFVREFSEELVDIADHFGRDLVRGARVAFEFRPKLAFGVKFFRDFPRYIRKTNR